MMTSTSAWVCNITLLSIFLISLGVLLATRGGSGHRFKLVISVTNVGGVSSAFMDLAAKGWSAALEHGIDAAMVMPLFWLSLTANVLFLISMRASMIYGCKRCDVLLFVPLNTVLNILYSVLAGMVVMQEWKQVISWAGLLGASTSVLGGVVMLVSGPARKDPECEGAGKAGVWGHSGSDITEDTHLARLAAAAEDPPTAQEIHKAVCDGVGEAGPAPESMSSPFLHAQAGLEPSQTGAAASASDESGPRRSRTMNSWRAGSAERKRKHRDNRVRTWCGAVSSDESDPHEPHKSRSVLSTLAQGLRPDMLRLNTAHREAAKVRRKWDKVKRHLREMAHSDSTTRSGKRRLSSRIFSSLGKQGEEAALVEGDEACYASPGRAPVDSAGCSEEDEEEDSDSSLGTETSSTESAGGGRLC